MRAVLALLLVMGCDPVTGERPEPPDPDADEPERVSLAQLRQLPDGPVNVTVIATHTYLRQDRNFHLQAEQGGPAVSLFVPANATPPEIELGNTVTLHVTEVGTFMGNKQILAGSVLDNDDEEADLDALSQLLTVAPNEDLEAELVRIQRGTVMSVDMNGFTVLLTSNTLIDLFSPVGAQVGLCAGATFDVRAPVIEFQGTYEVSATAVEDFTNVNTSACQ